MFETVPPALLLFDAHKQIQTISLSSRSHLLPISSANLEKEEEPSSRHRYAAIGCGMELKVVRIDLDLQTNSHSTNLIGSTSLGSYITDLAWNVNSEDKIAGKHIVKMDLYFCHLQLPLLQLIIPSASLSNGSIEIISVARSSTVPNKRQSLTRSTGSVRGDRSGSTGSFNKVEFSPEALGLMGGGGNSNSIPQYSLKTLYKSDKFTTCVNKITWHAVDQNLLATANQDGVIRMFDIRSKKMSSLGQAR